MRAIGKSCFGGAFLTSDREAAELKAAKLKAAELKAAELKAADEAIKFELSQAEQEAVRVLSQK